MASAKHLAFDKRILERNLEKGVVSRDELNTHLSSLPDLAGRYDLIQVEDRGGSSEPNVSFDPGETLPRSIEF